MWMPFSGKRRHPDANASGVFYLCYFHLVIARAFMPVAIRSPIEHFPDRILQGITDSHVAWLPTLLGMTCALRTGD